MKDESIRQLKIIKWLLVGVLASFVLIAGAAVSFTTVVITL